MALINISHDSRDVDGKVINTWKGFVNTAFCRCNIEAGTNGYQGGDAGHGCRAYFRIEADDRGEFDLGIDITRKDKYGALGLEVNVGGDDELSCIIESLDVILRILREQQSGAEMTWIPTAYSNLN